MHCNRPSGSVDPLRITVIGVGNPLRGDDGAGRRAVQLLRPRLPAGVEVRECDGEMAILIEASTTVSRNANASPGTICSISSRHSWAVGSALDDSRAS